MELKQSGIKYMLELRVFFIPDADKERQSTLNFIKKLNFLDYRNKSRGLLIF